MATAPAAHLSGLLSNLRILISNSAAFRTWTTSANPTAALAHIKLTESDPASNRPFCVIGHTSGLETPVDLGVIASGTRNFFDLKARLYVIFQNDITETADFDAQYEFENIVGAIIAEIQVLAGSGGYLNVVRIECEGVWRSDDAETESTGAHFTAQYIFWIWGAGA